MMTGQVAIIGTGLIGQAWAISFASAGYQIRIWDANADIAASALSAIGLRLATLQDNALLSETATAIRARITVAGSLEAAVIEADYIQENVPEDLEIKRAVIGEIDEACSSTAIIASSTSALLPSRLFSDVKGAGRCLIAHPVNPPYLIRAVELIGSSLTTEKTIETCAAFLASAGHKIVRLNREIDGFVVNRLQGALLDEAFRLVEDGIAEPEDIDVAIRDGLANRWVIMGPFETIDLNAPGGVTDYVDRYGPMYDRIAIGNSGRPDWTGQVVRTVERSRRSRLPIDDISARSQWRDEQLIKLRIHKKKSGLE